MTEKIKHFVGLVPYATHTTHRIPAPRFDQASGPGNTDLNPPWATSLQARDVACIDDIRPRRNPCGLH
jgi:hypothetical protein